MSDQEPTIEQIDATIARIGDLARAALIDHPQRDRALEMLSRGAWLCSRRDEPHHLELFIGWLDDPALRPDDVDPLETIPLVRLPRRVVLATPNADS